MRPVVRSRRPFALILVVGLTAVAGACGWDDAVDSRSATAGLPTIRQDIQEHDWLLLRPDSSLTVDDDQPVTFAVTGDVASGTAPCNRYHASFELGGELGDGGVEISDVALTRRACEDPTMRAEDELVAALGAVDHVTVDRDDDGDDDRLTLTGDDGLRLTFRPYDADDADGAEDTDDADETEG